MALTGRPAPGARPRLGAAVLAAGAGVRFAAAGGARHKLEAEVGGRRLVDLAVEAALHSGAERATVVLGPVEIGHLDPAIEVLYNPDWSAGIATSLQVAVRWADQAGLDALVVGLADQPGVGPAAWRAVAAAPDEPPIAVATYRGRRGNPVRLHRAVWPLLPRTGDEGARAVVRGHPSLVGAVPCDGDPHDVDTLEDLDRWS